MDNAAPHELHARGRRYVLHFGNLAYRRFEREAGHPLPGLRVADAGVTDLTVLLWAGLLAYSPEATMETADEIMDELGYAAVGEVLGPALADSPPLARRTSPASSETRSEQA